jgi:hypothetical protein
MVTSMPKYLGDYYRALFVGNTATQKQFDTWRRQLAARTEVTRCLWLALRIPRLDGWKKGVCSKNVQRIGIHVDRNRIDLTLGGLNMYRCLSMAARVGLTALGAVVVFNLVVLNHRDRQLDRGEMAGLFGGDANRCCGDKTACNAKPAAKCNTGDEGTCTGIKEEVNKTGNIQECNVTRLSKTCNVATTTHVCMERYYCIWTNPNGCIPGSLESTVYAPDSCTHDCD